MYSRREWLGKSTLVKGILGLHTPNYGQFVFEDGLKQKEIGYLPQQTLVQKDFPASVWEVVLSGRLNKKRIAGFYNKEDKAIAQHNLEKLGIPNLKRSVTESFLVDNSNEFCLQEPCVLQVS